MAIFKMVRNKLSNGLEIPADALGGAYRLQIIGNTAIIAGCVKIIKYKSEEITLLTKEGNVSVCGEHLKCIYFFEGTVEIRGEIECVRMDKK